MQINDNATKLQKSYNELQELQLVLEKAGSFFDDARKDAGEHQRELELSGLPSRGPDDRSSLLGGDSAYGRGKQHHPVSEKDENYFRYILSHDFLTQIKPLDWGSSLVSLSKAKRPCSREFYSERQGVTCI